MTVTHAACEHWLKEKWGGGRSIVAYVLLTSRQDNQSRFSSADQWRQLVPVSLRDWASAYFCVRINCIRVEHESLTTALPSQPHADSQQHPRHSREGSFERQLQQWFS